MKGDETLQERICSAPYTDVEQTAFDGINAVGTLANGTATAAGWYIDPKTGDTIERNFGEVVCLMHSELSEALEAFRKSLDCDKLTWRNGVETEFADCVLRIMDTAVVLGYDVAGSIVEKNRFNQQRDDHKLENRAKAGGKKF